MSMRKLMTIAATAGAYLMVTAAPAFAQSEIPQPPDGPVGGVVVTPPGGTAFTGADVGLLLVAIVACLAIGVGLLVASRRRAASVA